MKRLMGVALALAGAASVAGVCMGPAFAQAAAAATDAAIQPQGKPQSSQVLRDAEFGVTTRSFGLQRRVQMYQWQAGEGGYARVWSERPIDSAGFAAGHENPDGFPLHTRYWIAERIELDGKPLDEDVLKQIGQWRDFRPGFSALPGNLSASFEPEGDGLGSAENPLQPQVGDLRVTWRELRLPPLAGKVALEDGVWIAAAGAAATPAALADAQPAPARTRDGFSTRQLGLFALMAAALVAVVLVAIRRRRALGR